MKKKAIKIAASTAVAASAFVAAAPAQQADAAVNVNQLVSDAQNAGTVLKWAISVEGSADYVTQPLAQYNAAKASIKAAEAAAAKLSVSEKLAVDAKLVDAKIQVTRAGYYIDAITSSNKIKELTATLDAAIASGDIAKVEAAYHKATAEFRKQAKLLDRVYGQTTRDGIRNAVKPALEKSVASVKNEVTVSMLVAAAAADVKAGKIAEAHAKIAEAQAILDANDLKWETALQKSVTDAKTALPAIPGNVTVETAAFHGEVNQSYAVVANFKTSNGALYNGPVALSFVDSKGVANTDYGFVTVNGLSTGGAATATADAVNGKVVVTVTSGTAIAGGKVVFETYPNGLSKPKGETVKSDTLNFYTPAADGTVLNPNADSGTVKYVDAANNYFVTNDLVKYELKASGNVYQDANNNVLTTDAFKAKLSKNDRIEGTYYKTYGSTLKLVLDYVAGATFAVDQSDDVVSAVGAIRVEGNSAKLSGTGEAGKMVYVYRTTGGNPVAQVQVGSNGIWSTSVPVAGATEFAVRQAPSVNYVAPSYVAETTDELIKFIPGKFTVTPTTTGTGAAVTSDDSLTGDTFVFDAVITEDGNSTAVVASNAQITLIDGDATRATYTNGVNNTVIEESADGFTVTFGAPTSISGGNNVLNGVLTVSNVTGVTNAYKLKANVSGSISGY